MIDLLLHLKTEITETWDGFGVGLMLARVKSSFNRALLKKNNLGVGPIYLTTDRGPLQTDLLYGTDRKRAILGQYFTLQRT